MRARTWEIHIPELRPGPARNQLGAGDGAGGGVENCEHEEETCEAFFLAPVQKKLLVQEKTIGARKNGTRIGPGPDLLFS